jgi:hypothetical protein
MNDDNGFIFQDHVMERLILNGHRRRRLLGREQKGQEKDQR